MIIDIEKTRKYYECIKPDDMCSCDYCHNFYLQVRESYTNISRYMSELGTDIEKPFETSPLEPDEDGIIEYCPCQYVVFGKAPKDFIKRLDDVTISLASSYPDINLTEDYFVLDIYPIKLKWIM